VSSRRELLADATEQLANAGVGSPEFDAAELLAHVLGITRSHLPLVEVVDEQASQTFREAITRRAAREPLQHITGEAHFRHLTLSVGPGVFVPRPETELLAGWAIGELDLRGGLGTVVDLCTGSGAVALSIATEVPTADVHACELSDEAMVFATANRDAIAPSLDLRHADMAVAFGDLDGTVDVLTCNPPYIPLYAWESVVPEARDHDPHLALFSGDDGLDAIRVLERRAAALLRAGGVIGVEHADSQGADVPAVFTATGRWGQVRDHVDLAGRPRFTTAKLAR
jgi:release factor glutamine methyltransferase